MYLFVNAILVAITKNRIDIVYPVLDIINIYQQIQ